MPPRAAHLTTTVLLVAGLLWWALEPGGRQADLVLTVGLLALMAMPMLQLAGAIGEEVRAREWGFVAAGVGVLLLLCVSVAIAFRH